MNDEITKNLSYLVAHVTNISQILIHLIEKDIISWEERDIIINENTDSKRNYKLLQTIRSKDWLRVRKVFLDILRETKNGHCAEKIEENVQVEENCKKRKISLLSKWWPEEKQLVNSFYERKENEKLLIEELKNKLDESHNGMTVISQKITVSGLGGVGKTTTAKWFANYFSQNYDHIIWIDCGEGSLMQSFNNLARNLAIKQRVEMDLSELARKSFDKLQHLKCLLIFDNAECYVGNHGIREVLPKNKSFHTIITSRNREWGSENGNGKIFEFQLDAFKLVESMDFLKKNIKNVDFDQHVMDQIKILCELLGNLPLALQIAVATINNSKSIDITEYIRIIRKTDDLIHAKFDDYEKTINITMKISLDVIRKCEGGKLANQILSTFGYIRPDFVVSKFFETVERKTATEIHAAADILERFSLITKSEVEYGATPFGKKLQWISFSIHRLFQQVIRHNNEKTSAQHILRKILNCDDHLDYKLIPYTFADEEIKKEFSEIKVQLIDQLELEQMSRERRFQEAADLALIIKNTLGTPSSIYNYGNCLEENGEIEEALSIFENLYKDVPEGKLIYHTKNTNGVMDLWKEPTKGLIAGKLYLIYFRRKEFLQAFNVLKIQQHLIFKYSLQCLHDVLHSLSSISLETYLLCCDGLREFYFLELREPTFVSQIKLKDCSILDTFQFPSDLQYIHLSDITVIDENRKELKRFKPKKSQLPAALKYFYSGFQKNTTLAFSTDEFYSVDYLELLPGNELVITSTKIIPKSLKIGNCTIICNNGQVPAKMLINEFINFRQLMYMRLINTKTELSISMSDSILVDGVCFDNTSILDWGNSNWIIKELILYGVSYVNKTQLAFTELDIENSSINLSYLPPTLKRLFLNSMDKVTCSERVTLNDLCYLHLYDQDPACLSYFLNCINLTCLILESCMFPIELFVDKVPRSVKKMKLGQMFKIVLIGDHLIQLDLLVLQGYSLDEIQIQSNVFTTILKPIKLAISCQPEIKGKSVEDVKPLLEILFKKNSILKTVAIGEFEWEQDSFASSLLSKYVDKESQNYLFLNANHGAALEKYKFLILIELNYYSLNHDLHKLEHYEERLKTFQNWKVSFISAEFCASAGFFYLQFGDKLQCAFCQKQYHNFQPSVLNETLSHHDYCSFIATPIQYL